MEFITGCNYWASNAGTEMWKNWDEDAIREDLHILSAHGIHDLRVFPNWRDFQPVEPLYGVSGRVLEYRLSGARVPENPYYLEEEMLTRFRRFCAICEEYGMRLIVGLLAGFMSGTVYLPPALYGRDLFTDPLALLFEQKYVSGLVRNLRTEAAIAAWDLGNECGGMSTVKDEASADCWTAVIANAIRANDQSRPIISGFNTLVPECGSRKWTIRTQAENCDILTTHPYPYFDRFTHRDRTASLRAALHATCECRLYGDLGRKPCLVEEIGTIGPMVCNDQRAADFLRVNLFSNWANGANGVMWWCANEQIDLQMPPYTMQMEEVELGMIDRCRRPKPVLLEMKRITDVLSTLPLTRTPAKEDAVCILTKGQDQWGAAYMTYCLSKQAGLNLRFAYGPDGIPDAQTYLMPSVSGRACLPKAQYEALRERVRGGATLYLSNDDAILADFAGLTGLRVTDSCRRDEILELRFQETTLPVFTKLHYDLDPAGAEVLAADANGNPAVCRYKYGEGTVFYLNFPLETMLLEQNDAFDKPYCDIYKHLFQKELCAHPVRTENPNIGLTLHPADGCWYCTAINYSPQCQQSGLLLQNGLRMTHVFYGDPGRLAPFEASIFQIGR